MARLACCSLIFVANLLLNTWEASCQEQVYWVGYQDGCAGQVLQPDDASWADGNQWLNYVQPFAEDEAIFDTSYDPQGNGVPTKVHFEAFHVDTLGVGCNDHDLPSTYAVPKSIDIRQGNFEFLVLGDEEDGFGNIVTRGLTISPAPVAPQGPSFASLTVVTSPVDHTGYGARGFEVDPLPVWEPLENDNAYEPARVNIAGGSFRIRGEGSHASFTNSHVQLTQTPAHPASFEVVDGATVFASSRQSYIYGLFFNLGYLLFNQEEPEQEVSLLIDGVGSELRTRYGGAREIRAARGSLIKVSNGGLLTASSIGARGQLHIESGGMVEAGLIVSVADLKVDGGNSTLVARDIRDASRLVTAGFSHSDVAAVFSVSDGGRLNASAITVDTTDLLEIKTGGQATFSSASIDGRASLTSGASMVVDNLLLGPMAILETAGATTIVGDAGGVSPNEGEVLVANGGDFTANGNIVGDLVASGGVTSFGVVTIDGDVSSAPNSEMQFSISDSERFSQFHSTGSISLAGKVSVELIDGYQPADGQQFMIGTASNVLNEGAYLTGSSVNYFILNIDESGVFLEYRSPAMIAGDFNEDGTVDAADYTVWRDGFGVNYDQGDYWDWQANYGLNQASMDLPVPAPTPTAAALAALACVGALSRRRR